MRDTKAAETERFKAECKERFNIACKLRTAIEEAIREETQDEEESLLLLVEDGCPSCEEEQLKYKDEIEKGNLLVLNINTELGKKLIEEFNIEALPEMLLVTKTNDETLKVGYDNKCIEIEVKK
jgi:hypothetical protein